MKTMMMKPKTHVLKDLDIAMAMKKYKATRPTAVEDNGGPAPTTRKLPFSVRFQAMALRLTLKHPEWATEMHHDYFDLPLFGAALDTLKRMPESERSLRTWCDAFIQDQGKAAARRVFRAFVTPTASERARVESKMSDFLRWNRYGEAVTELSKLHEQHDVNGMAKLFERTMEIGQSLTSATDDLVSLSALRAEPEADVRWLVENRFRIGGVSMMAGKPGVGKGTLARCLASAVARGREWLGHRVNKRGPVIYIAGVEEHREEVKDHFDRMGASDKDRILMRFTEAPPAPIPYLRAQIKRHRPVLIIIDGMSSFLRSPSGASLDYDAMGRALDPVLALARETGVHILLIHHMGKGERNDPFDAILGSTAIRAKPDTRMAYRKYEGKYRTLQTEQRYGPDLPETTLDYDPKTGMVSLGQLRSDADATLAEQRLLACLAKVGKRVTEDDLEQAELGRTTVWKPALRRLVKSGKVARTDKHGRPNLKGGRANPFYYGLPAKTHNGTKAKVSLNARV